MFDALTISHFRAFGQLEVAPLHRVNLIAGGNNVGKTSLLEAVWFASQKDPLAASASSLFRRSAFDYSRESQTPKDDTDNFWKWLFFQKDTSKPISFNLSSVASPESNRTLEFALINNRLAANDSGNSRDKISPPPPVCTTLSAFLQSPVADGERVNNVALLDQERKLAGYLQMIDPRIVNLKYLKLPGHKYPYVYVDVGFGQGKELIPATQLGQGTARMLGLFASLMTEGTQILLIDEFENGLQHDALVPVWSALGKIARDLDIQIFATTHSYECIAAAHEAFAENAEDFAVIKLRPDPALGIAAFVLDHAHVDVALETEMEIR
ncbi:MAG: AAA family ATPase [Verrucomicrobiota bacterium]|jgi:hypothetical protein|nr:AAA family ATPase [Verrucomicrobiota bacterium]